MIRFYEIKKLFGYKIKCENLKLFYVFFSIICVFVFFLYFFSLIYVDLVDLDKYLLSSSY